MSKKRLEDYSKEQDIGINFKIEEQKDLFDLPDADDVRKINIRYPLIVPYAYAHIYWDEESNELVYFLEEPTLTYEEQESLILIEEGIEEIINLSFLSVKSQDAVIKYLEKNIRVLVHELGLSLTEKSFLKIMYYVYRDFVGMNEVEPLLRDYFIEDIECNGVDAPIYIVHRKYRNMRTNISFKRSSKLTSFVEKLAQKCGKYISYANPLLDGRLQDGSRANATYAQDISSRGPTFTIRKFTKDPWSPVKLIQFRSVSPEMMAYLWLLIEYETNLMIIGGTGSGKTSLLNSLAFFIPPSSRIVSIEDTRELNIVHENWLPSVSREGAGIEARSEVDLFTLLRESFRQRPDYVIVGEIRGKEAYVLFQGAASGHPVISTMHAEDVETMIRRLETKPIDLSPSLIKSLDAVCVMGRAKGGNKEGRRLTKIIEIIDVKEGVGNVNLNNPFVWDPKNDTFFFKTQSHVLDKIVLHHGLSREKLQKEFLRRTKFLMALLKNGIVDHKQVQHWINLYYKDPKTTLMKFGID
jgi:archaeal flagellar protein FlaI